MTVNNGNLFARFAIERNKINRRNKKVNRKLFEPNKNGTLSVQKIDNLKKDEIHEIGKQVAEARNKSNVYGWAEISRGVFEDHRLKICIDNDPRPGHTTISNWPEEPELNLSIQQDLASASCGVLI